jgi:hypothetical protein
MEVAVKQFNDDYSKTLSLAETRDQDGQLQAG